MPINPDAVGAGGAPVRRSWDSKDALLYAVGVGAGTDELEFTTENTKDTPQKVLPTFAVIIGGGARPMDQIGSLNFAMMVHGEQGIELFGEIPADGEIETTCRCIGIWDKGAAAVLEFESTAVNTKTGELLLKTYSSLFCRGEGGFGGERGPSEKIEFPTRAADHEVVYESRRIKRSPTVSPATATRCTRTRALPPWAASSGRSCTACVPGASPEGRCCTPSAIAILRASRR